MNKNIVITAVVSATLGGIAGGAITYLTVNKKLRERYEAQAEAGIADVKRHYSLLRHEDGTVGILGLAEKTDKDESTIDKGRKLAQQYGSMSREVDDQPHSTARTLSIFDRAVDVGDDGEPVEGDEPYLTEMDNGYEIIDGQPFLISEAEFFENVEDFEMDTLTYYSSDDTLTDDKNVQIPDVNATIGERHLNMFNPDPKAEKNSIYVRNDIHKTLYEIIYVEESYAAIVMGVDEDAIAEREAKRDAKRKTKKLNRDGD